MPADLAETYPPIPENENAAVPLLALWENEQPAYWRAIRMGERPAVRLKPQVFDADLPLLGKNARSTSRRALSTANLLAGERFLQEQREHMEAVRTAIHRPRSRFPIQLQDGYAALLPHLAQIQIEAQKFQVEAFIRGETGQPEEAIEAIQSVKGLADALRNEPLLIGQLVRLRCLDGALDAFERLLSRRQLAAEELDHTVTLLEEMSFTNALRLSFLSERVVSLSVFEMSPSEVAQLISKPGDSVDEFRNRARGSLAAGWFLSITGLKTADRRFALETLTRAVELTRQDPSLVFASWEQLEMEANGGLQKFPPKYFSRMTLAAFGKIAGRFVAFESRRRAAIMACQAEKYRIGREGRIPEDVASLKFTHVDATDRDPFNGELLRIKRLNPGYVVYSVGPDRTDDGGRERRSEQIRGYDVTFVVER